MSRFHSIWLLLVAVVATVVVLPLRAQQAAATAPSRSYTVFLRSMPIGQETMTVAPDGDGWVVRGSNRLGPPLDVVTRRAEIHYDGQWRPTRMRLEGTARGQEVALSTTFADGEARSEISAGGTVTQETDPVAADTVVLPNTFLGSYGALARRLVGQPPGATLRGYIAPQGEVAIRLEGSFAERIETPQQVIDATRHALVVTTPPPGGDVPISVWTDAEGALLRMSIPSQMLEVAREDVASAATRTTSFSIPGDETVRIPASGFSLAASVAKPAGAQGRLPAVIVIGGSGPVDRDSTVAGIPVMGQVAADLVKAGFLVVRYDKRGIGQSGGRAETATLNDYAEDVRAIIKWLEKERKDVNKKRIALVGHSEGAWVAMRVAARDKRVAAVALVAGAGTTGAELVLEQQRNALARMNVSDADKQAKIELQRRINQAAIEGRGWDDLPEQLRGVADTPWFQSFLAFDPADVMKDVRQPVLIVQPELDAQVPPHHGDRLATLAEARRRRSATTEVVTVPGVNHLLVPARTGDVDEYATLADKNVSPAVTGAIAEWLQRIMR